MSFIITPFSAPYKTKKNDGVGDDHEYWITLWGGGNGSSDCSCGADLSPLVGLRFRVNREGTVNAPRHRPRGLAASAQLVSGNVNGGKFGEEFPSERLVA